MANPVTVTPDMIETDRLRFTVQSADGPTAIVNVLTKRNNTTIGVIRWYGAEHQYAFLPAPGAMYIGRVLADIYDVIGRMMQARRKVKGQK